MADDDTFSRLMARLRPVFTPAGSGGARKGSTNRRGALKIHQVFHAGSELPAEVAIGPAREHDAKAWKASFSSWASTACARRRPSCGRRSTRRGSRCGWIRTWRKR